MCGRRKLWHARRKCPRLLRMQAWAVPRVVGEPERWELTGISGGGLRVSNGWLLGVE
jgi:hypothetical protein